MARPVALGGTPAHERSVSLAPGFTLASDYLQRFAGIMTSHTPRACHDILVIGFGNALRHDDAVGPLAAEAVGSWMRPGVHSLVVHQLTPELAEEFTTADLVIFLDADAESGTDDMVVRPLEPVQPALGIGHSCDPQFLLALAHSLHGSCPPAWLVTLPAEDFSLGEGLSPMARHGLEDVLRLLLDWIDRLIPGATAFPRVAHPDAAIRSS